MEKMIELAKLQAVDEIIVHDNCPDGIASAMILHDALPNAKIIFCQYETELHKTMPAKPGQLFADFSPHRTRTQEFLAAGAIVLDHHGGPPATVTKAFVEKGLGAYADEKLDPGVSGALLAYREVWEPLVYGSSESPNDLTTGPRNAAILTFATLAGIRDTWQKEHPRWREACENAEAIRFWPWEMVEATPWDKWASQLLAIGPILYDRNLKHVDKCIEGSLKYTTEKGLRVTIFEGLKPTSDAAEVMGESNDLTVGLAFFCEDGAPKMVFSTRSRGDFHCQNFALAHGGGGHVKAAGFSIPLKPEHPQPYELVKRVVARYEAHEEAWAAITAEDGFSKKVKEGKIVPQALFDQLVERGRPADDPSFETDLMNDGG
jgi:hypothetical protein